MSNVDTVRPAAPSLTRDPPRAARFHLGGRRGLVALAALAVAAGAASSWGWLVAAGMAPLLVAVLPCAAMCALGLCMRTTAGGSCSTEGTARDPGRVPVAADPDQLTLSFTGGGAVAAPAESPPGPAAMTRTSTHSTKE